MIDVCEISEAIVKAAAAQVPELARIYTELVPEKFTRPALLVSAVEEATDTAGINLICRTLTFILTVFGEENAHGVSSKGDLLRLRGAVQRIFAANCLRVADRVLGLATSAESPEWDKAFIEVRFSFYDDAGLEREGIPLMETLEAKVIAKTL